jgi:hypothetical protein
VFLQLFNLTNFDLKVCDNGLLKQYSDIFDVLYAGRNGCDTDKCLIVAKIRERLPVSK